MAVIIQKQVRKLLAHVTLEREKRKDKCFKNLAHNFKKNINFQKISRNKFNIFKCNILSQLKEMEELL